MRLNMNLEFQPPTRFVYIARLAPVRAMEAPICVPIAAQSYVQARDSRNGLFYYPSARKIEICLHTTQDWLALVKAKHTKGHRILGKAVTTYRSLCHDNVDSILEPVLSSLEPQTVIITSANPADTCAPLLLLFAQ